MKVLLDTCVLSELRRGKSDAPVTAAVAALPHDALFLSVITLGEIVKGVDLLAEGRKKKELRQWLQIIKSDFSDHILGIDPMTAQIWGEITARAQLRGILIPASDGLIAATALQHGLHLMTRNTKHFIATGVLVLDPWKTT